MNITEEYEKQSGDFIKLSLARTILYITLFLTSSEAISTMGSDETERKIDRIYALKKITERTPTFGDAYFNYYLKSKEQSKETMRGVDTIEADSVSYNLAFDEQNTLATELQTEADKIFKIKIGFLNDASVDLRIIIFILPIILILIELYFGFLRTKVYFVRNLLKEEKDSHSPFCSKNQQLFYNAQPLRFIDWVLSAINVAFFLILALTIWEVVSVGNDNADVYIGFYYFYLVYGGLIIWLNFASRLEQDQSKNSLIVRFFKWSHSFARILLKKIPAINFLRIGSASILITLFLSVFVSGCDTGIAHINGYEAFYSKENISWAGDSGYGSEGDIGRAIYVFTVIFAMATLLLCSGPFFRKRPTSNVTFYASIASVSTLFYFTSLPPFAIVNFFWQYTELTLLIILLYHVIKGLLKMRKKQPTNTFLNLLYLMLPAQLFNFYSIIVSHYDAGPDILATFDSAAGFFFLNTGTTLLFLGYFKKHYSANQRPLNSDLQHFTRT